MVQQKRALYVHKYTHMDTTPNTPTAAAPVTLVTDVLLVKIFKDTAKKRSCHLTSCRVQRQVSH